MNDNLTPDFLLQLLVVFEGLSAWKVSPWAIRELTPKSDLSELNEIFNNTSGNVLERSNAVIKHSRKQKRIRNTQRGMKALIEWIKWARRLSLALFILAPIAIICLWLFCKFSLWFPYVVVISLFYMVAKVVLYGFIFGLNVFYEWRLKVLLPDVSTEEPSAWKS